jgi:DnaJ-class molecular chaperone
MAAKKTMTRLREEYVAGREGRPEPARTQRPASELRSVGPAWWQVLEVPREASLREVTVAYRERIRKNHPDKVAHLSAQIRRVAEDETRRLNAAYEEAQRALGGGGKSG